MNDKFEKAFEKFLESRECEKYMDYIQECIRNAFAHGYKMGLQERLENDKINDIEKAREELLRGK